MDNNIKRSIIVDNYNNPLNKGLINDDSYCTINMNSLSCIDNLDYMIKIEDNIIKDIKYDGEACVISTAASSLLSDLIIGKTVSEVLDIIDNYEKMISEEKYDKNKLDMLVVFDEISKQPNRKKCALLPFHGVKKAILKYKE